MSESLRALYFANYHDISVDHPFGLFFSNGQSTAYAIYRESGAWSGTYPDLRIAFHTGIKFGANAGYKGMNFYTDYDMSTLVMSVNNADYISGGVYIHTDLRAPIMYDANNTAYYSDPGATTNLFALTVNQTISGNITGTASNITSYTINQNVGTGNNVQFNGVGAGTAGAAGEVRATGNITAYYSSDRRLKENVVSISNALDKINKISGVEFDWTNEYIEMHGGEDGYFIRKHDVGVIAQEIQDVLPDVVAERIDGYLAVRYEKIVPLLIEAIKEQQQQIEQLKTQITGV